MALPHWIRSLFPKPRRAPERRPNPRRSGPIVVLGVEPLEERVVPAVYNPGDDGIGVLNQTGTFTLGKDDTLRLDLGGAAVAGTDYDRVNVSGAGATVELGGTLEVTLAGGFQPAEGDKFTVLSYPAFAGAFNKVDLPTLDNGLQLVPVVGPTTLTLVASRTSSGGTPVYTKVADAGGKLLGFFGSIGINPPAVELTGLSFTTLGQTFAGDFTLGVATVNGSLATVAAAKNVAADFVVGGQSVVTVRNGAGGLVLSTAGVAADFSADVTVAAAGVSLSGRYGLKVNTGGSAVKFGGSVGSLSATVNVPAGPFVRVEASKAALTIGTQKVPGDFAVEATTLSDGTAVVRAGAANVAAFLGSADGKTGVAVSAGKGGLLIRPEGVAAQFSGAVAVVGGPPGLTLSGTATVGFNNTGLVVNETFTVSTKQSVAIDFSPFGAGLTQQFGGSLSLDAGGFVQVAGGFSFSETSDTVGGVTTSRVLAGATLDKAFFGAPATAAAPNGTGVLLTAGTFGLVLNTVTGSPTAADNKTTYALSAAGTVSVVGVSGLTLSGTGTFRKNTTGGAVDAVEIPYLTTGGKNKVTVAFAKDDPAEEVTGTLRLDAGGFVQVTGGFAANRSVSDDGKTESVQVGVAIDRAFFGDPGATAAAADDTGLVLTDGRFGLLLNSTTGDTPAEDKTTYALSATGTVAVVGVSGLTLGGTATFRKNATGDAVEAVSIAVPAAAGGKATTVTVGFAKDDPTEEVTGTLDLDVGGFVSLDGRFVASRFTDTDQSGVTTTSLKIGAAVDAFLGANRGTTTETGVRVTGANLGLVVYTVSGSADPADDKTTYALAASSGTVGLVGLPSDLSFSGAAVVRVNTTGKEVDESFDVPGLEDPLKVTFDTADDVRYFGGALDLKVGGFTAAGAFSFESKTTATESRLLVGATGVTVGLDAGAVGFQLTGGTLTLLATRPLSGGPAEYALDAGGTVTVTGLPLSIGGTLGLRVNTTGGAVEETGLTVPALDGTRTALPDLKFDADSPAVQFSGTGITLGVDDVFMVGGDVTITPGAGTAASTITVGNVVVSLFRGGSEAVRLAAPAGTAATFAFGGTDASGVAQGFTLVDFKVGGFSLAPAEEGNTDTPSTGKPAKAPDAKSSGTTIGPLTITDPTVKLSGLDLQPASLLSGVAKLNATVTVGVAKAELALGSGGFTATATNVSGSFGLGVDVGFKDGRPYVGNLAATGKWDLSVGSFEVSLLDRVTVAAKNVAVNPSAAADEDFVSFGLVSATLGLPSLRADGFASNFAISGAGKLVAKPGFSVGFQLSPGETDGVGLPSFVPLSAMSGKNFIAATATWADLTNAPGSFNLTINAAVNTSIAGLTLGGSVTNLVISSDLVAAGEFPVVSFDKFTVTAGGSLFGATLNGTLVVGLVRLAADGTEVTGTSTTPVAERLMYYGIQATLGIPGVGDTQVRLGLTDQGLTSLYVYSEAKIPLGQTGLVLTDLRAGVTLNADPLPAISDPRDLLGPAFVSTFDMTDAQWQAALKRQAIRQLNGGGLGYLLDLDAALLPEFGAATVSATLAGAFLAQQFTVRQGAGITNLGGGQWLVRDGDTRLLVQQNGLGGPLAVTRLVLSLDQPLFAGITDGAAVPQAVRDEFAAAGYQLGIGVTVRVVTPGSAWEIVDGERTFTLRLFGTGAGTPVIGVTGSGGSLEQQVGGVVRIEAGATVYHETIPKEVLNAKADVIITTDGKFVISSTINLLGGVQKQQTIFYADLSNTQAGQSALLFYSSGPVTGLPGMTATYWGEFSTGFVTPAGDPVAVPDADRADLALTPVRISLSGGAALTLGTPGIGGVPAVDVITLTLTGDLALTIATDTVTLDTFANIGVSGLVTIPSVANLSAVFVFSPGGVWGAAQLGTGLDQLEQVGITVAGTAYFGLNTTGTARTVGLRKLRPDGSLPGLGSDAPRDSQSLAPNSSDIYVAGTLGLRLPGATGSAADQLAGIQGVAALNISRDDGLKLFVAGTMNIGPQAASDYAGRSFAVSGAIFIGESGFAALLNAWYKSVDFVYRTDFAVSLYLNTTGERQSYTLPGRLVTWLRSNAPALLAGTIPAGTGGATVVVPAVAPRRGSDPGTLVLDTAALTGSPYFVAVGTGRLALQTPAVGSAIPSVTVASLDGQLFIAVTAESFTLDVNANLSFGPLANARAQGTIYVVYPTATAGPKVFFQIAVSSGINLGVLSFTGPALLVFNNTGSPAVVPQSSPQVTVPAENGFLLSVNGSLVVAGGFTVDGAFALRASATEIAVTVNGTVGLFDNPLTVNGGATIFTGPNPGLVLRFDAGARVGFGFAGLFDATADAVFQLNTRSGTGSDLVAGVPVPRGSFRIGLTNVEITLLRTLTLRGSAIVERVNGVLRLDVQMGADFLGGLARLSARGFISSEGEFLLALSGELNLGVAGFGVFGTASFTVSRLDSNGTAPSGDLNFAIYVGGAFSLDVKVASITLFGVNVSVAYGNDLLTITPGVVVLGQTISHTFVLGSLNQPFVPNLATLDTTTRTLRLNVGDRAGNRGVAQADANEAYTVARNQNGDIVVSSFGVSQTFTDGAFDTIAGDFTRTDGNSGLDTLDIAADVAKRFDVTLGDSADVINRSGTAGSAYILGDDADVQLLYAPNQTVRTRRNARVTFLADGVVLAGQSRPDIATWDGAVVDSRNVNVFDSGLPGSAADKAAAGVVVKTGGGSIVYGTLAGNDTITYGTDQYAFGQSDSGQPVQYFGYGGDNTLSATTGGADLLVTGDGNDTVTAGGGADNVATGNGNDAITSSGDGAVISAGNGNNTLTLSGTGITVTSGNGDTTVDARNAGTGTRITLGGGTNVLDVNTKFAAVNAGSAGTAGVTIWLDPTNGVSAEVRNGVVNVGGSALNLTGYRDLVLNFGSGADTLTLAGTNGNLTVIGGGGADNVTVESLNNPTTLNLSAGTAVAGVTVRGSTAPLTITGNTQTTLSVDRTAATESLAGVLSAAGLTGLGLGALTYAGLATLNVALGSGADQFAITNTPSNVGVTVTGRGGADQFVIDRVSSNTAVFGGTNGSDSGSDVATLRIPSGGPAGAYTNLSLTAGSLILDGSKASGNWEMADRIVRFNGTTVVDASSVPNVRLVGDGNNSLTVSNTSSLSTDVALTPNRVTVTQTSAPVTFANGTTGPANATWSDSSPATISVNGENGRVLAGVASPDGRNYYSLEYVIEGVPNSSATYSLVVKTYRLDPRAGSMYYIDRYLIGTGSATFFNVPPLPPFWNISSLATDIINARGELYVSSDGRYVYAVTTYGSRVFALGRNADSGSLSLAQSYNLSSAGLSAFTPGSANQGVPYSVSRERGLTTAGASLPGGGFRLFAAAASDLAGNRRVQNRVFMYDFNPDQGGGFSTNSFFFGDASTNWHATELAASPDGSTVYAGVVKPNNLVEVLYSYWNGSSFVQGFAAAADPQQLALSSGATGSDAGYVIGLDLDPANPANIGVTTALNLNSTFGNTYQVRYTYNVAQNPDSPTTSRNVAASVVVASGPNSAWPLATLGRGARLIDGGRSFLVQGLTSGTNTVYTAAGRTMSELFRDPILANAALSSASPVNTRISTYTANRPADAARFRAPVVTAFQVIQPDSATTVNGSTVPTPAVHAFTAGDTSTIGAAVTITPGQTQGRAIRSVTAATVFTPNAETFAVSAEQDALLYYSSFSTNPNQVLSGFNLLGASSVNRVANNQEVFVTAPGANRLSKYGFNGGGTLVEMANATVPGARVVRSTNTVGNDVWAFVAGSAANTVYTYNSGLTLLRTTTGLGFGVASDMIAPNAAQVIVSGTTGVQFLNFNFDATVNPNGTGFISVPNAGVMAYDANRNMLYVARPAEGMVDVYAGVFTDTTAGIGNVRLVQSIAVGGRVSGLSWRVADSENPSFGRRVLNVLLPDTNALAAYVEQPDGRFIPAGRQQFPGLPGLLAPTTLVPGVGGPTGANLLVGTLGSSTTVGGLSLYNVSYPTTTSYSFDYVAMNALALNLGAAGNSVTVANPNVGSLNVNPGSGPGSVTIGGTRSGSTTTVNLGGSADSVDLRASGGAVSVNGNGGGDTFRVAGGALGGTATFNSGSTLFLDFPVATPSTPNGSYTAPGSGQSVNYSGIQRVVVPAVAVNPAIAAIGSIAEGNGLTLAGSATGGVGGLSYAWDLNGDGLYGDAAGANPVFTWGQLQGFGVTTVGTYRVALRVTDANGNTGATSAAFTVTDTPPTVMVSRSPASGTPLAAGQPLVLTLSSVDPGSERATAWRVVWGDGTVDVVPAGPDGSATARHVYPVRVGTGFQDYTVSIRAVDPIITNPAADGSNWYTASGTTVRVTDLAPTPRTISGAGNVDEQATYSLNLAAAGPGVANLAGWLINWGDGATSTAAPGDLSATHVYTRPGAYTVTAFTRSDAGLVAADITLSVSVTDVAPTLFAAGSTTVDQGARYSLQLSAGGVGRNGPVTWTVNWGDGTTEVFGPVTGPTLEVEHVYSASAGVTSNPITVTATDQAGTYPVTAPTVSASPVVLPRALRAGLVLAPDLNAAAVGQPGYIPAAAAGQEIGLVLRFDQLNGGTVTRYTVEWGDGTVETYTALPGAITTFDAVGTPTNLPNVTGQLTVSHRYPTGGAAAGSPVRFGQNYTIRVSASVLGDATVYQATDLPLTVIDPLAGAATGVVVTAVSPVVRVYDATPTGNTTLATFVDLSGDPTPVSAQVDLGSGFGIVPGTIVAGPGGQFVVSANLPFAAVGTYTANVSLTKGATTFGPFPVSVTIGQRALTITSPSPTKIYGDSVALAGFTTTGLVGTDSVTGVTLASAGSDAAAQVLAGGYEVTATGAVGTGLGNYAITYTAGVLTVAPRALTVTSLDLNKVYGDRLDADGTTQVTTGAGQLVNGDQLLGVTLTSPGSDPAAGVGGYTLTPSAAVGIGLANYSITYVGSTLTVDPRPLSVSANLTKVYGDGLTFAGTEFQADGLVNGDAVTSAALASSGAATAAGVGTYTIALSNAVGSGLSNYAITYAPGVLTVSPRTLTVTAADGIKVYGDSLDFTGTEFSSAGLVNGDTLTGVTLASGGASASAGVGVYEIAPSDAAGTGLDNYLITYAAGSLAVAPRTLTVTAADRTKVYGDLLVSTGTEFSAAGLVNGDTVAGVDLSSPGAVATATVAGSPYLITPSTATGNGLANYAITYLPGSLTVTPRDATVYATDVSKTYGDTFTFAGTEFVVSGLVNGDTVDRASFASLGAGPSALVSTAGYVITPSAATGNGLANYNLAYSQGTLTVTPRPLTVTAGTVTKTYGDEYTPTFTEFQVGPGQLVNGDVVSRVRLDSTGFGQEATIAGGPYPLRATAATGTGLGNYAITYVDGSVVVGSRTLTITADLTKVYGDVLVFAGTDFRSAGLVNGDAVAGVTLSSTGADGSARVGAYAVTVGAALGSGLANYTVVYVPGTLTVTPRPLTLTADDLTKVYGEVLAFAGTEFSTSGLVNGDAVTGVVLASAGSGAASGVGGYAVTATGASGTGLHDYDITYVPGTLTVTPRPLTAAVNPVTKPYGEQYTFGFTDLTATGLANGDAVTGADFDTRGADESATAADGPYPVSVSNLTGVGLDNYDITYQAGALTIGRRSLTITVNPLTKVYGDTFAFVGTEFTAEGLVNGDTVSGVSLASVGAVANAGVGGYAVSATGATGTGLDDYDITYVAGTLAVTPRPLTIRPIDATVPVGGTLPPLSVSFSGFAAGDSPAVLTSRPALTTPVTRLSGPGVYPILADGAAADNYAITYAPGNLTVTPVPQPFVVGSGPGVPATVRFLDMSGQDVTPPLRPFGSAFTGGVRVASADVSGDGVADVIAATGPGATATVVVVDGVTGDVVYTLTPFGPTFTGGLFVAAGDFDGRGHADLVIAPAFGGGPRVQIVDGKAGTVRADYFVFEPEFRGGLSVAVGDVDGDGSPDLVVGAGAGGGPRVAILDGGTVTSGSPERLVPDFFAFAPTDRMGVNVAVGDIDRDGRADVFVAPGSGGGPNVVVFAGAGFESDPAGPPTPVASLFAADPDTRDGAVIAAKDLDGDGRADLLVADAGGTVKVYAPDTILGGPAVRVPDDVFDPFQDLLGGVFVG